MKIRLIMSMLKIMKELKRQQIMRRIEQQDANQPQIPSPSQRDEATTPLAEKQGDLKKQSQFAPAIIGVTPFLKGDYGNKPASGAEENKPNQSQFLLLTTGKTQEFDDNQRSLY